MKSNFTVILSIKFTDFYILYTIFYLLLNKINFIDSVRYVAEIWFLKYYINEI